MWSKYGYDICSKMKGIDNGSKEEYITSANIYTFPPSSATTHSIFQVQLNTTQHSYSFVISQYAFLQCCNLTQYRRHRSLGPDRIPGHRFGKTWGCKCSGILSLNGINNRYS